MKTAKWDPAEFIDTKEDVIAHLEIALEEGDMEFLLKTVGYIARSRGMVQIARELGVTREGLYKSLSPSGNPSFETLLKLLDIMGFRLRYRTEGIIKLSSTASPLSVSSPGDKYYHFIYIYICFLYLFLPYNSSSFKQ
jgi:probable addiction module antidote protein